MPILYRTSSFPAAEQWDRYREIAARSPVPIEIRGDRNTLPNVRMEGLNLGVASLITITAVGGGRMGIHRTPRLIRRSDPGAYRVVLTIRGHQDLFQHGRHTLLNPRQLGFYDMSRPFHGERRPVRGVSQLVMLTFPHALLPLPARTVQPAVGAQLSADSGIGTLVVDHIARLAADADHYTPADRSRLSNVTLELVTALLAHDLEATEHVALEPEAHRRLLLLRIHQFVNQRLTDPNLTPAAIAAAHHVSLRSLQKLFQDEGTTVAGWIRSRRLARCQADLADPYLRSVPIHQIASHWGFSDPAHFSRLFRASQGMSPRDWREASTAREPT